jgi:hypothetical protein
LKDTAERIKAVDRAASMIEEILKQGTISESTLVPFSSSSGQVILYISKSLGNVVFFGRDMVIGAVCLLCCYIRNSA